MKAAPVFREGRHDVAFARRSPERGRTGSRMTEDERETSIRRHAR